MNAEEFLERIQTELQRRFRASGSGSVGRVERSLDLAQGYFRDQRRPGRRRVDLKVLHDALAELGVDISEFFASVLGTVDPGELFQTRAKGLERKRRSSVLQALADRAGRGFEGTSEAVEVDFEALDAQRDTNPSAVRRTTRDLVGRVADRDLPRLLGIYGSACRALGQLDEAQVVLAKALGMVHRDLRPALAGELLLRCASLAADRTQYDEAVPLTEQALVCYAKADDPVGIGKSLLNQGMAHGCMERSDEELRAFHAALGFLPTDSEQLDVVRSLFSCRMNLAVAYRKRGELETAQQFAAAAEELGRHVGPALFGKLVWLRGTMARQQEHYAEAEDHLQRALEIHRDVAPVVTALLAVEVVQVQMLQGHTRRAHETARMMASLLRPLEGHPLGSAAITELVRCALSGRGLSLAFLEKLAQGIERQGRAQLAGHRS